MDWLSHNPAQYSLKIEKRTDTGADGRRRTASYLLPKDAAGLLDAAATEPDGTGRDAATLEGEEPDGTDGEN